jgi:dolichyl-phosphate-mannose-protein mannosyltransferase
MGRVTYVHHYYPALWFAILVLGFVVDWSTARLNKNVQMGIYFSLYAVIVGLYWMFRAISFGMEGPNKQWAHLKWFDSWRMTD